MDEYSDAERSIDEIADFYQEKANIGGVCKMLERLSLMLETGADELDKARAKLPADADGQWIAGKASIYAHIFRARAKSARDILTPDLGVFVNICETNEDWGNGATRASNDSEEGSW